MLKWLRDRLLVRAMKKEGMLFERTYEGWKCYDPGWPNLAAISANKVWAAKLYNKMIEAILQEGDKRCSGTTTSNVESSEGEESSSRKFGPQQLPKAVRESLKP